MLGRRPGRGRKRIGYAALIALGVAGCSAGGSVRLRCPTASIIGDAAQMTQFVDGPGRDLIDIQFDAEIEALASDCEYNRAQDRITTLTAVRIVVSRGPAAQSSEATLPFFVAVVDDNQRVLARERFESTLVFDPNRQRTGVVEEIEEVIPLPAGLSGANYEILVGFELTSDQLDFNRRRRRR